MLEQALEWIVQHRAAMVALVVVLALTLPGRPAMVIGRS
jgi:hypothetical protein